MRRCFMLALAIAALPGVAQAKTVTGGCSLTVDGRTYLKLAKSCSIDLSDDGSFSINTGAKRANPFFAYLTLNGDGTASGYWNAQPKSTHAHAPLGTDFRRQGACWINRRARICASR